MLTVNDLVANVDVFINPSEKHPVIEIYNLADGKRLDLNKAKSYAVKQALVYYESNYDGPAGITMYVDEKEN